MIEMWDLVWELQMGSRLRIDISSSNFPEYSIHSNFAGGWAEQKEEKKARQTIWFGNGESRIVLPER